MVRYRYAEGILLLGFTRPHRIAVKLAMLSNLLDLAALLIVDMVNLLAGVYRRAGLPARTVVGIRIDQEERGVFRTDAKTRSEALTLLHSRR